MEGLCFFFPLWGLIVFFSLLLPTAGLKVGMIGEQGDSFSRGQVTALRT